MNNGNKILKKPPYGNYKVLGTKGQLMFRCDSKKVNWYLKRGLAKSLDETTIQLLFEPNGPGHVGDVFYLSEKNNACVVCGSHEQLTRHHVVPHCYRKFFPDELKSHSSHDILVMCVDCHEKYEACALDLRYEIAEEYGMPIAGILNVDQPALQARKAAYALKEYRDKMPADRIEHLTSMLRSYYNKENVTEEDIASAAALEAVDYDNYIYHGQYVASKIQDFEAFVKRWRNHFVTTMEPQHLPPGWNADRSIWKRN